MVGDSIIGRINEGLQTADYLVAVLSPRSVIKLWVQRELNSAMMRQLDDSGIKILPVLIEPCDLPALMADIKYANFTSDFSVGFRELLDALRNDG